jgi:tetratricopeptide (TPR) repeat protein
MSLAPGTVLAGRYRVMQTLGEGGMGSVYQVEDLTRPGVVLALKELLDDAKATPEDAAWARRRFDDEIALMRTLSHPRIPRFREALTDAGHRCFAMEFVPGATLEERLATTKAPLPERDVLRWDIAVCQVLSYLHQRRPPIILRDLKPGNIMVTPNGEVYLIDFGIARTYKPGKQSNTENLGTMTYASPEHLGQTQTDARSDVYSLGATMFHLLTNVEPSPMETPARGLLRRLAPAVSEATEDAVIRAMRLDPAQRFQSADDLCAALEAALKRIEPPPAPALRPAPSPARAVPPPAVRVPVATLPIPATKHARAAKTAEVNPLSPTGVTICPRCGFVNRRNARFCAQDGVALRPSTTMDGAKRRAAPVALISPPPTTVTLQRVTEAFTSGRFQQAIREGEAALAQGRPTAELYAVLGRSQRALGRHEASAAAFAEAARLRPTAEALLLESAEWRAANEPAKAQVALARARQLDPRNGEIALQLALVCLQLGHLTQAEGELRDLLAAQPDSAPALVALGRVLGARNEWQQAIDVLRRALAGAPDDASAHFELGRVLLMVRRRPEAVRELERAAKLSPNAAQIQKALGMAYHASGQRPRARTALQRAADLDPSDAEAQRLLREI